MVDSVDERVYEKGEQAYYYEDGIVYRVTVLENNSDNEVFDYKLLIDEDIVLREGMSSHVGEEFTCWKPRPKHNISGVFGFWSLNDER